MKKVGRYQNRASTTERRRNLRVNQTRAESKLWNALRKKQLGVKFRRQYNIDYYIVDFYCHKLRLIIELDGSIHGEEKNKAKDKIRENYLKRKVYKIIRYRNDQVKYELRNVIQDIVNTINQLNYSKTPPNLPW